MRTQARDHAKRGIGSMRGASTGAMTDLAAVQDARRYLKGNAAALNSVLAEYWQEKRESWAQVAPIIAGAADAYELLTSDGKKIRASLVKLGYDACRHPASPEAASQREFLRAAASVEVLHNAFLIHDDIVDNSSLRRNVPTVHRRYADASRARFATDSDALEYGRAIALNFGDKGQALAQDLLISSGFPTAVLLRGVTLLSEVTIQTVMGQLLDVEDVRIEELTEELVLLIHQYKTAHYTIMLPLLLGAVLADASARVLESIRGFAVPIGIAFQIQDDILGLFGNESELGKPVDSDIKEAKKTLLFVHAYALAGPDDREFLRDAHGKADLRAADVARVRAIVKESGALARSEAMARARVEQGKVFVDEITAEPHWRRILRGLADYFILRRT